MATKVKELEEYLKRQSKILRNKCIKDELLNGCLSTREIAGNYGISEQEVLEILYE